jgi:hypothetical protein
MREKIEQAEVLAISDAAELIKPDSSLEDILGIIGQLDFQDPYLSMTKRASLIFRAGAVGIKGIFSPQEGNIPLEELQASENENKRIVEFLEIIFKSVNPEIRKEVLPQIPITEVAKQHFMDQSLENNGLTGQLNVGIELDKAMIQREDDESLDQAVPA